MELGGPLADPFNADFVRHASHAVLYYFKHELGRQTVSVGEFAGALEKVLHGFTLLTQAGPKAEPGTVEADLRHWVGEYGEGGELFFYPRLREELRQLLLPMPRVVRLRGLRECVMQLAGVRRWSARCRQLEEQIVAYLRECLNAERRQADLALMVD